MKGVSRLWITVIALFSFLCVILLTPTFMGDKLPSWWGKVFSSKGKEIGIVPRPLQNPHPPVY
ncbi:MAG: hypothetical protein OXH71_03960, partial [Candidatus Dadabacteria bacterium]|nr:hypothetical protein [Candidatus Dadabacteria bacterium]